RPALTPDAYAIGTGQLQISETPIDQCTTTNAHGSANNSSAPARHEPLLRRVSARCRAAVGRRPPHLGDRRTVTKNLEHRRIPLLHHTQLHQPNGDPLQLRNDQSRHQRRRLSTARRGPSRGTQLPEPLSPRNRNPS